MKKALVCAALTLAFVLAAPPLARMIRTRMEATRQEASTPGEAQRLPSFELASGGVQDAQEATLYFRFGQTKALGMERVQLDISREETVASLIVQRLIEGPSASHGQLSGVFPQGTRVISIGAEGGTAFVTLSSAFLGRPDGAPADWEDSAAWQEEAALRRMLAVQSVVLSLTEDGRYQRVQFYVADSDDDAPRRIELYWFDTEQTDPAPVLAACGRDEAALLTPHRALEMILSAWQQRDWAALYALLTDTPSLSAFEARMKEIDVTLLAYEATAGTVSADGRRATLVLDAQTRAREGGDAQIIRESVPLARVSDNWTMTLDTLLSLMVRD